MGSTSSSILKNTIVAGNAGTPDCSEAGPLTSLGHNVVGSGNPHVHRARRPTAVHRSGTLTATSTALQPSNTFTQLQIVGLSNATITVNGVAATNGQTVSLPPGTTSVQVVVTRAAAGAFTARLSITDGCGAWSTLVGGGAGVS